ncbi:hypothetical protein QOT17_005272 [Balamuthia mandrillaris]
MGALRKQPGTPLLFLWTLVMVQMRGHASAQSCAVWDGHPAICAQSPDYQPGMLFYVPPGWTAEAMIQQLTGVTLGTITVPPIYDIHKICMHGAVASTCSSWLRPCDNTTFPFPVPVQQCRTVCEVLWAKCGEVARLSDAEDLMGVGFWRPEGHGLPILCDQAYDVYTLDNVTHPMYEQGDYQVTINNITRAFSCYNQTKYDNYQFTECPEPMKFFEDVQQCYFICPFPYYEEEQYDALNIIQVVLGWFSLMATAVTFLLSIINPALRKFPISMLYFLLLSLHLLAWGMVLPSLVPDGKEQIWCGGEDQPYEDLTVNERRLEVDETTGAETLVTAVSVEETAVAISTACSIQGALIYHGIVSATVWWCLIGFNTGYSVLLILVDRYEELEKKVWYVRIKQSVFYTIGLGVPMLFSIILFASDAFGFLYSSAFCFITDKEDSAFLIAFWFVPSGIMLFVCISCTLFTVVHIVRSALRQGGGLMLKSVPNLSRILAFMLVFLLCYIFIFTYDLYLASNSEAIHKESELYVNCLITPFGTNAGRDCEFDTDLAGFPGAVIKSLAFSALGLTVSVTLLCNPTPWAFYFKSVRRFVSSTMSRKNSSLKMTIVSECSVATEKADSKSDE